LHELELALTRQAAHDDMTAALHREPAARQRRDVVDVVLEHGRERGALPAPEAIEELTVVREDRHPTRRSLARRR
jgi:hypothetical protein